MFPYSGGSVPFRSGGPRTPKAFDAWLEVGDERFNSIEIQRLYEAAD
jgi:hypothetical protein